MAGAIFGQVSFSGDLPSPEAVREGLSRVTGLAVAVETQAADGTEQAPTDVVASAHLFGCLLTIATLAGAGVLAWLWFGEG